MRFWKETQAKNKLFVSAELASLWPLGDCLIGEVSFESCAYVAGYVIKKQVAKTAENKARVEAHYAGRVPEFCTMSLRPGIGAGYYEKYKDEVCAHDSVVIRGHEVSVPKYYDTLRERHDPKGLDNAKRFRRQRAREKKLDNTNWRLHHKECFLIAKRRYFARRSEV